jgi:hypothetical protein
MAPGTALPLGSVTVPCNEVEDVCEDATLIRVHTTTDKSANFFMQFMCTFRTAESRSTPSRFRKLVCHEGLQDTGTLLQRLRPSRMNSLGRAYLRKHIKTCLGVTRTCLTMTCHPALCPLSSGRQRGNKRNDIHKHSWRRSGGERNSAVPYFPSRPLDSNPTLYS